MKLTKSMKQLPIVLCWLLMSLTFRAQAAPGDVDLSFNPGAGPNDGVESVALQTDGKVVIGGDFRTNGVTTGPLPGPKDVARLNPDGSLDTTFDPGTGASNGVNYAAVECVALQADGKVLMGGYFTTVNGNSRNYLARLN